MTGEKPLSPKQERFALALALGARPEDAYNAAGYRTVGLSANGIADRAAKLIHGPGLRKRLAALTKLVGDMPVWSRTRAVSELLWLADTAKQEIRNDGISTASANSFLNAVKELNRLEGADKPPEDTAPCGVVLLPQLLAEDGAGQSQEESV